MDCMIWSPLDLLEVASNRALISAQHQWLIMHSAHADQTSGPLRKSTACSGHLRPSAAWLCSTASFQHRALEPALFLQERPNKSTAHSQVA